MTRGAFWPFPVLLIALPFSGFGQRCAERADQPDSPSALFALGLCWHSAKDYSRAGAFYERALALQDTTPGSDGEALTETLIHLGLIRETQGRDAEAGLLFERALRVRENSPRSDDAALAVVLEHYARLLRKMNREAQPETLESRAREIRARHVERLSAELSGDVPPGFGSATIKQPGVTAPQLIYRVDPEYSPEARLVGHQGSVELQVDVAPDGKPYHFRLRESVGLGLDERAVQAVSQWRFKPALKDGEPVTVTAVITIHFRLL